uniref:Uncharacterized protein n=1 Tax=Tetranychus urticae TaxID=32264 RepID=T1KMF3_TETUR
MSADNINSDETVIKVKLSSEDYHDIVIDWTDTSQAYEQQVFSRLKKISGIPYEHSLAEISGIPVEQTFDIYFLAGNYGAECFRNKRAEPQLENTPLLCMRIQFNRENLLNLMNGNEPFRLALRLRCDDNKHFYIGYNFVPERLIGETECTLNFCHHLDNKAHLNKLRAIVTNDALQSQMAHLLVQPRWPENHEFHLERWHGAYRRFNVMQYYYRTCYPFHQTVILTSRHVNYVPPQLYLRTHG